MKTHTYSEQEIANFLQDINQKINHRVRSTKSALNNLTILQIQTLRYIHSHEQITTTDLSRIFQVSKPSASALVDRLVENGWIKRNSQPEDRRTLLLTLSKKGMEKLDTICDHRSKITTLVLKSLTRQEKQTFAQILEKINKTLE